MSDKKLVIKEVEAMAEDFANLDMEKVLSYYEEGATLILEPGTSVTGMAQLRQGFQGFFAIKPTFTFDWHDVNLAGDIAVHTGPWTMEGTHPESGEKIIDKGLSVSVWRKSPTGKWKMVIDNPKGDSH